MVPKSSNIDRDFFLWDYASLEKLSIDKQALLDEVMPMFDRPEDHIQWSV